MTILPPRNTPESSNGMPQVQVENTMRSCISAMGEEDEMFDPSDFFLSAASPSPIASTSSSTGHTVDPGDSESACVDTPRSDSADRTNIQMSIATSRGSPNVGDFIALGAVRLHEHAETSQTTVQGLPDGEDNRFPHDNIMTLTRRGVLASQHVAHRSLENYGCLRIWMLPEDRGSQNASSTVRDNRRYVRRLLRIIDTMPSTWDGNFEPWTPIQTFLSPPSESESLFHIFNTLDSPGTRQEPSNNTTAAVAEALAEVKTPLYPYQKRSILTMLERETKPARAIDPRKPEHFNVLGEPFYMDIYEGAILAQPQHYEESRGGVLAETMGYGKTLICLALIFVTRGHYPSVPYGRLDVKTQPRDHTASLLEMAARAATRHGVPWKAEFYDLEKQGYDPERVLSALRTQHRQYVEPIYQPTNPMRKGKRLAEKTVCVSCTTLVVVPPNLLMQWQQEIKRHLSPGALDILIIEPNHKAIPPSSELMKYDLILITKTRLEQEYRDDDLHQGKRRQGEAIFQSPLTEISWLRVICDEGHAFAGSTSRTNAQAMLDKMYVERRWVVSGTPSYSLVGVEVGIAADIDSKPSREAKINTSLQTNRTPNMMVEETKDIDRLRQLVVGFLAVPPWANRRGADPANWKKYLAPFDRNGRRRRTACLRTLLQSVVVRHRIQDIDNDLVLPPLFNKLVYLEPSYYDKVSLNLFAMLLTTNALTSERTDEDYFFHTKNRKPLDHLINNLRQASFHWIGLDQEGIVDTIRNGKKYLDDHLDVINDLDAMLLTEARISGERALNDTGWSAFAMLQEIGVYIDGFPADSATSWSLNKSYSRGPLLMGIAHAKSAQNHVEAHLDDPMSGLTGAGIRNMIAEQARAREQSRTSMKTSAAAIMTEEPSMKVRSLRSHISSPITTKKRASTSAYLSSESPLRDVNVVGFSSAKLAYLMDQVLQYQNAEKIIIFYDSANIAYWIGEALELLSLKFLIYASTLTVARRATYLATFNESEEFRILLMDLGQAALGLHIACASRVYIVSPIWQPNVESQAIKRAHRIGQTRPVYVETLILRGTLEEKMIQRRQQMNDIELKKAVKSLLDDGPMSRMIKQLRFLKFKPGEEGSDGQVARLKNSWPLFDRSTRPPENPDQGLHLVEGDNMAPNRKKQKKVVRMAGPSPGFTAIEPATNSSRGENLRQHEQEH